MEFSGRASLADGSRPIPPRVRRRQAAAAAGSLLFHLALFVVVFARASGNLVAADSGGAELAGLNVTLVRAAPSASAAAEPVGALRPLLAKYQSDAPPVPLPADRPASDLERLMRRVRTDQPPSPPSATSATSRPQPLEAADPRDAEAQTPAKGKPGPGRQQAQSGSTGGLWGAIAPCWRVAARDSRYAVTLEVALDTAGQLAKPPKILRDAGSALGEPRLRSEAQALAALDACLPRGDLRFAGAVYRLEFKPQ